MAGPLQWRVDGTVFRLLTARAGAELIVADLARDAGVDRATATNFVSLLQVLYLIQLVPAWSSNATTRAKRHPKVLICDTGLACDVLGLTPGSLPGRRENRSVGPIFENWVTTELHKQVGWAEHSIDISHFRDRNGEEVDVVLTERRSRTVAAVEVKLTSTPTAADARHLVKLRDRLGSTFSTGVVVHTGPRTVPLGDRLWAVPVGSLVRTD